MNIIVICLDTMRADTLGYMGHQKVKTPNMDQLAKDSIVFTNAFAEGLPTIPVRRANFTGIRTFPWQYSFDTKGVWPTIHGWHKISPEHDTLAEILLKNGYTTGLIADTYHMFKPTMNFTRGFSSYQFIRGQETDNYRTRMLKEKEIIPYIQKEMLSEEGKLNENHAGIIQYLMNNYDRKNEDDWTVSKVFLESMKWIEENKKNDPFFLWIDSFDPHEPWDPPKKYVKQYYPIDKNEENLLFIDRSTETMTEKQCQKVEAQYYGEITFVDKWIGEFINKLMDLNLYKDTMLILTSDHGTQLRDHGKFGKGGRDGENIHPFNTNILWLMKMPGNKFSNKKINEFVQNHDIFPTILNRLNKNFNKETLQNFEDNNVSSEYKRKGIDVWPLVKGQVKKIRDFIITGWYKGCAGVRDNKWNYTVNVSKDPKQTERLFNYISDPEEVSNISDDNEDIILKQRNRLEKLFKSKLPVDIEIEIYPYEPPFKSYIKNYLKKL